MSTARFLSSTHKLRSHMVTRHVSDLQGEEHVRLSPVGGIPHAPHHPPTRPVLLDLSRTRSLRQHRAVLAYMRQIDSPITEMVVMEPFSLSLPT